MSSVVDGREGYSSFVLSISPHPHFIYCPLTTTRHELCQSSNKVQLVVHQRKAADSNSSALAIIVSRLRRLLLAGRLITRCWRRRRLKRRRSHSSPITTQETNPQTATKSRVAFPVKLLVRTDNSHIPLDAPSFPHVRREEFPRDATQPRFRPC